MKFKTRAYRPRHKPGRMNNTEFEYSKHLELLKQKGEILDYSFECTRIKIGEDCWYTPDFRVLVRDRESIISDTDWDSGIRYSMIEFHEVKGTTRKRQSKGVVAKPFVEDDAMVKLKACATLHPFKFILTWIGLNGQWERRAIN